MPKKPDTPKRHLKAARRMLRIADMLLGRCNEEPAIAGQVLVNEARDELQAVGKALKEKK